MAAGGLEEAPRACTNISQLSRSVGMTLPLSALFSGDPGRITFVPDGSRCKLVRGVREVRFALAQCTSTVSNLID